MRGGRQLQRRQRRGRHASLQVGLRATAAPGATSSNLVKYLPGSCRG